MRRKQRVRKMADGKGGGDNKITKGWEGEMMWGR